MNQRGRYRRPENQAEIRKLQAELSVMRAAYRTFCRNGFPLSKREAVAAECQRLFARLQELKCL